MPQLIVRVISATAVRRADEVITNADETLTDGTFVEAVEGKTGVWISATRAYTTRMVGSIKVGRSKTTARDTLDKALFYLDNSAEVAVVRSEPTEEEVAARHEARVRTTLRESLDEGLVAYHPAKLLADAASLIERRGERGFMASQMDTLMQGQALFDFYSNVQSVFTGEGPYAGDILASFAAVMARALDLSAHTFRPLSRSTSTTNNLAEDLARWAASQHLDGMMGGGDLLRKRMMELQMRKLGY